MAIGDDAVGANLALVNGSQVRARNIDDEINLTRDYVAREITARKAADDKKVDKFADGAAFARLEPGSFHTVGFYTVSSSALYYRPVSTTAEYDRLVITQSELDAALAGIPRPDLSGYATKGEVNDANGKATSALQGNLYSDSYNRQLGGTRRAAWLQDNGQIGYASSSERYKKNIRPEDVTDEQILMLTLVSYQWKVAVIRSDHREMGLIAERLVEAGLGWAAFFNEDGTVEGINYEMIGVALLPAVQRLIVRVARLEDAE